MLFSKSDVLQILNRTTNNTKLVAEARYLRVFEEDGRRSPALPHFFFLTVFLFSSGRAEKASHKLCNLPSCMHSCMLSHWKSCCILISCDAKVTQYHTSGSNDSSSKRCKRERRLSQGKDPAWTNRLLGAADCEPHRKGNFDGKGKISH